MSKQRARRNAKQFKKSLRKNSQPKPHDFGDPEANDLFRQVFCQEGAEPITDELIDELTTSDANKWNRDRLQYWKSIGAVYSRPRNSILEPMEFGRT